MHGSVHRLELLEGKDAAHVLAFIYLYWYFFVECVLVPSVQDVLAVSKIHCYRSLRFIFVYATYCRVYAVGGKVIVPRSRCIECYLCNEVLQGALCTQRDYGQQFVLLENRFVFLFVQTNALQNNRTLFCDAGGYAEELYKYAEELLIVDWARIGCRFCSADTR